MRVGALNLLSGALAPSTRAAYSRAMNQFGTFAAAHHLPTNLPITVDTLSLFITHLFNRNLPASSIASIMSAVSYSHKIRSLPDPTRAYPIQQMLSSVRKTRPSVDRRQPITDHILQKLINALSPTTNTCYS